MNSLTLSRRQAGVVRLVWMLVALVLAVMTIIPLLWMLSIGFKSPAEVFQPVILPKAPNWSSFIYVLTEVPFIRYLGNTFFVSAAVTILALWFHTMAGYALARLRFPGMAHREAESALPAAAGRHRLRRLLVPDAADRAVRAAPRSRRARNHLTPRDDRPN